MSTSKMLALAGAIFPKELNYSIIYNNEEVIRLIGIFGALFFSISSLFFLKRIFNKEIGLIINKEGLIDNSSAVSIGLIKWEDIDNVRAMNFSSIKFILIDVKNPNVYLQKAKNSFIQKIMKKNIEMCGTPITISSNILKCDIITLEKTINTEFEKWKTGNVS